MPQFCQQSWHRGCCPAAIILFTDAPVTRTALADTLSVLQRLHPNLLIMGESDAIEFALDRMRPHLSEPIASWLPWTCAALPDGSFRTLIVSDVDEMNVEQQNQLMTLNDDDGSDVQVISTTKTELFAVVERGAFLERLYYQLNVLFLDLRRR